MSYKRILVPVDGSPTATMGMIEAIKLAKEARGKLMLLYVVEEGRPTVLERFEWQHA